MDILIDIGNSMQTSGPNVTSLLVAALREKFTPPMEWRGGLGSTEQHYALLNLGLEEILSQDISSSRRSAMLDRAFVFEGAPAALAALATIVVIYDDRNFPVLTLPPVSTNGTYLWMSLSALQEKVIQELETPLDQKISPTLRPISLWLEDCFFSAACVALGRPSLEACPAVSGEELLRDLTLSKTPFDSERGEGLLIDNGNTPPVILALRATAHVGSREPAGRWQNLINQAQSVTPVSGGHPNTAASENWSTFAPMFEPGWIAKQQARYAESPVALASDAVAAQMRIPGLDARKQVFWNLTMTAIGLRGPTDLSRSTPDEIAAHDDLMKKKIAFGSLVISNSSMKSTRDNLIRALSSGGLSSLSNAHAHDAAAAAQRFLHFEQCCYDFCNAKEPRGVAFERFVMATIPLLDMSSIDSLRVILQSSKASFSKDLIATAALAGAPVLELLLSCDTSLDAAMANSQPLLRAAIKHAKNRPLRWDASSVMKSFDGLKNLGLAIEPDSENEKMFIRLQEKMGMTKETVAKFRREQMLASDQSQRRVRASRFN
jgi:hypothetical protein